jgi:hypothetical protein
MLFRNGVGENAFKGMPPKGNAPKEKPIRINVMGTSL